MQKIRKSKKKTKVLIAAVLVIAVIGGAVLGRRNSADETMAKIPETEQVTVRSLIKSVGATGTVVSVEKKEISSVLTGVTVENVAIEVGDVVEAGDILISFNMEDIEESLSSAEEKLSIAKQQNAISVENAQRNVDDAKRTESYQIDQAATNRDSAYDKYVDALNEYNSFIDGLNDIKEEEAKAKKTYKTAETALQNAEKDLKEKEADMNSKKTTMELAKKTLEELEQQEAGGTVSGNESVQESEALKAAREAYETALTAYNDSSEAYVVAQTNYEEANISYTTAKTTYNTLTESRKKQETTANSLASNVNSALSAYNSQSKTYDNTVASQASSVASAVNSQKNTRLSASTENEEKQVEQYQEQLAEGDLLAPIGGIVTAINVEQGDTYNQGTLVTIQDNSSYEVEAQIGEYDISDIEVGQKVLIKTEATREEELEGTIIFISPTASQNAGSSGVTYTVRISVDTPNDRLRLDMSASLSIIIEQHENALTVPYNAIQTDVDENTYVEVYEDGEVKKVFVTILMESNYYTEITSKDLKEGQLVVVVSESGSTDPFEMMMQGGGF